LQLFDGDLALTASEVAHHKPVAAWLFVPHSDQGRKDIEPWTLGLRKAFGEVQAGVQVGSLGNAANAVRIEKRWKRADVVVLQGLGAGGHGLKCGIGLTNLVQEVVDRLGRMGTGDTPGFRCGWDQ
jgi:nitronate monooxygenase